MFQDKTWIKMPKWTILEMSFLWQRLCWCYHYWDFLRNIWCNNWQFIIDVVENLGYCLIFHFLIWYFFWWKISTFEPKIWKTNIFCSEWLPQRFKKCILLMGSSKQFWNYLFLNQYHLDQIKTNNKFRSTFLLSELFAGSCEQVENILP